MREKLILYTAEMTRAILEDRKDVTRRVTGLKKINNDLRRWQFSHIWHNPIEAVFIDLYDTPAKRQLETRGQKVKIIKSPYQVGDLLWSKEAWWDLGHMENGKWSGRTQSHTVKPRYVADCPDPFIEGIGGVIQPVKIPWKQTSLFNSTWRKRSSRFMPKWAARTWLEVISVRAERSDEGLWVWRYEFKEYLRQGSEEDATRTNNSKVNI